jgi:hypothetical protein
MEGEGGEQLAQTVIRKTKHSRILDASSCLSEENVAITHKRSDWYLRDIATHNHRDDCIGALVLRRQPNVVGRHVPHASEECHVGVVAILDRVLQQDRS